MNIKDMQWCIDQAKATDAAIVRNINSQVDAATKHFTDAGIDAKLARKMGEKCVERALYDIQTELGGW